MAPPGKASAACQVEGCCSCLQEEKSYNRRCRICEAHKTAMFVAHQGLLQRFCAQCAKLHPVEFFKGNQRNCQAALAQRRDRLRSKTTEVRVAFCVGGACLMHAD